MRPLGAGGVQIHPGHPRIGKPLGEEPLQLLGADTPHPLHRAAALGAGGRNRFVAAAVVAAQAGGRLMHGERDAAATAFRTSPQAGHCRIDGIPAPIEEQEDLLLPGQRAPRPPGPAVRTRAPRPPRAPAAPLRRSTTSTGGSGWAPARSGSRTSVRRSPTCACSQAMGWRCPARRRAPSSSGAHHRHVPRVIAGGFAVLVARLVLLIHHDARRGSGPERTPPSGHPPPPIALRGAAPATRRPAPLRTGRCEAPRPGHRTRRAPGSRSAA